jgi:hypothetical protein
VSKKGYEWQSTAEDGWLSKGGGGWMAKEGDGWLLATYCRMRGRFLQTLCIQSCVLGYTVKSERGRPKVRLRSKNSGLHTPKGATKEAAYGCYILTAIKLNIVFL